jgi:hypothetical protein
MKRELANKLVLAVRRFVEEGRNALRQKCALASQAMCSADEDHDEHDEEAPSLH